MASRYDVAPKTILPAGVSVVSLSNAELLAVSINDPKWQQYAPELRARGLMAQWEAANKNPNFTLASILKDAVVFYGAAVGGAMLAGGSIGATAATTTTATTATTTAATAATTTAATAATTGGTMAGLTFPTLALPSAATLMDKVQNGLQKALDSAPAAIADAIQAPAAPAPVANSPLLANDSKTWMTVGAVGLAALALWKIAK